jgi:hypothetical protein
MKILYEIECQRTGITPKSFFSYCKAQAAKKGVDIETWANYEDWTNEAIRNERSESNHSDWDEPKREICQAMPYDWQLYLERAYNFILEFQFDDEKTGYGYMYLVEFER